MTISPPDATGQYAQGGNAPFAYPRTYRGPMPTPSLLVVGEPWAPDQLPDAVTQVFADHVGYQDLFSTLTPTGAPARGMYQGTYALTTGAFPRRA